MSFVDYLDSHLEKNASAIITSLLNNREVRARAYLCFRNSMSSQLYDGKVALADRSFDVVKSDTDLLFTLRRSSIHVYVNLSCTLLRINSSLRSLR